VQFRKLLEPATIGELKLRNHVIMAPYEKNYATPYGEVTRRYIDYLVERAKGGVGLIFVESMYVAPREKVRIAQLGIYHDDLLPGLREMGEAVHAHGAKIGSLIAAGGRLPLLWVSGVQPMAPSAVEGPGGDIAREMTAGDIKWLVQAHADAARRTKQAGWDIVMIHGAHGYGWGQFLSPLTNRRTDQYGGSLENRMKAPLQAVAAVRAAVGDDFPVAFRMNAMDYVEGGTTLEEGLVFAQRLEVAGVDLIDVSAGVSGFARSIDRDKEVALATAVKSVVNVPVTVAGRINDPETAERILEEGRSDFVSMARALHIDPHWVKKVEGGRVENIFRCPYCRTCNDTLGTQKPLICAMNPAAGREREMAVKPSNGAKSVLVVGGGPGGMEAARVAALRGHKVALYEKAHELGGMIRFGCKPPGKEAFSEITRYYVHVLKEAGVEVTLGREVTPDLVEQLKPDAVVVATGASMIIPFTPGVEQDHVCTALDVLDGTVTAGKRVVVVGGGQTGCETAAMLVEQGAEVVIVEPGDALVRGMGGNAGLDLRERLKNPKIESRVRTSVEEIREYSVLVQSQGQLEEIGEVDQVVLAVGVAANNGLADALNRQEAAPEIYTIGDCKLPRKIQDALYEGAVVGRLI